MAVMAGVGLIFFGLIAVVALIALAAVAYAILTYNRLVQLRARIENAWAQIDVQLKRRYDLIPNLVETVKGYGKYEKGTFEEITRLRSAIITGNPAEKAKANDMLTGALKSVFAVAENYPQLKANENYKALQDELAGTENKISYVRTAYNDSVLELNTAVLTFPANLIAGMLGFKKSEYFKTEGAERENVKVQF
jgi:LemA protein